MSQMLEALKRIESKISAAPSENHEGPSTDQESLRLTADPDRQADSRQTNDCGDEPTTLTLQFATPPGVVRTGRSHRSLRPWAKSAERDYLELATTVTGQLSKNSEVAILFTSPAGGEGKTSTVMGLAKVLAHQDSGEVLVVDGNPGRGGLTDWIRIEAQLGLLDVLSGEANWPEAIQATGIDGLSILPGRVVPSVDVNLADGAKLANLLGELRREFRFVLFDGPSLSRPGVAEMSRHFDAVYLIIELHRTSRSQARQAVQLIDDFDGRLLGCVLTNEVRAGSC